MTPADSRPAGIGVVWLWLAIAAYLSCVSVGRMSYHLAPLLAPLALLMVDAVMQLRGARPLGMSLMRSGAFACVAVTYLYCVGLAAQQSCIAAEPCWLAKPSWLSFARKRPESYEAQGFAIAQRTQPGDEIYVWGWSPGTYRFAYRRSASGFATLEKVGQLGEPARFILDRACADVMRRKPRVFVASINDWSALQVEPTNFGRWLVTNYVWRDEIEGMNILERRTN